MWILGLILVGAFVGLLLYGVIGTASWFWQIGEAIFESIRIKNDISRRKAEFDAKQPVFEAQRRESRRVATILTQRFVAHVLSTKKDDGRLWTLETAHRAWRQPRTVAEMRTLAESVGLSEFYEYDAYAIEMNSFSEDAALLEYGTMLGQIDLRLQELIRENGSAKRLFDLPEFADVMAIHSIP
jgi:hypothetical protein